MKTFLCGCDQGATLFFDSVSCTVCGRMVGFRPDRLEISAFDLLEAPNLWAAVGTDPGTYRQCSNYHDHQVCNWMVAVDDPNALCRACRLNAMIPNLGPSQHLQYWAKLEAAKRRALYTVLALHLPVVGKQEDPQMGLQFRFMTDKHSDSEFTVPLLGQGPVYTGHDQGDITINVAEADDVARTRARISLGEKYRTLLGHFRHEIGHYFWYLLVAPHAQRLDQFRNLFGDENSDYRQALDRHYQNGSPPDWQQSFISAYATMHPWEDWAETWAHYLHMIDTLETAQNFDVHLLGAAIPSAPLPQAVRATQDQAKAAFSDPVLLLTDWMRLAVGMNALNRSMGLQDAYPFVLTDTVRQKLQYVHQVVMEPAPRIFALTIF